MLRRVLSGISGNALVQAVNLMAQVIGIPLFIKYWGIDYYGEWIVLFTIPGYIAVSDLGLGTAATTEMSMMFERGETKEINVLLRNTFWFITVVGSIPFLLLSLSVFIIPWHAWLGFSQMTSSEFNTAFVILAVYVYLSILMTLPLNYYRVEKKYHRERIITTVFKVFELITIILSLINGLGAIAIAGLLLCWRILMLIFLVLDLSKLSSVFSLFPFVIKVKEVQAILKPGLSLMGFFLGQNLLNQGIVTIIGITLGSSKVVLFTTVRTLVNLVKQSIGILNQAIFSEFSYAKGKRNDQLLFDLFMIGMVANLIITGVSCLILLFWGKPLLQVWTGNHLIIDIVFLHLMILYIFLGAIANYALTFVGAVNRFKQLSLAYLLLTLLILLLSLFSQEFGGLRYVAILLGIFEFLLFVLAFRVCLEILGKKISSLYKFREVDWKVLFVRK